MLVLFFIRTTVSQSELFWSSNMKEINIISLTKIWLYIFIWNLKIHLISFGVRDLYSFYVSDESKNIFRRFSSNNFN